MWQKYFLTFWKRIGPWFRLKKTTVAVAPLLCWGSSNQASKQTWFRWTSSGATLSCRYKWSALFRGFDSCRTKISVTDAFNRVCKYYFVFASPKTGIGLLGRWTGPLTITMVSEETWYIANKWEALTAVSVDGYNKLLLCEDSASSDAAKP